MYMRMTITDVDLTFPCEARSVLVALGGTKPVQIVCSETHALAVAESGEVFAWGDVGAGMYVCMYVCECL